MSQKIWCAECEKDVEVKDGRCPDCNLNLSAVMDRLREEDAANKYREKAKKDKKPSGDLKLPPWLRQDKKD